MKRISTFIAVSIAVAYTFTGCQKFDYNPSMVASVNSAPFKSNGKTLVIAHVDTSTHNPQLVIITGNSDTYSPGTSFLPSIALTAPNTIGTYAIGSLNNKVTAMVYTAATGSTGTAAVSGQIVILNIAGGKVQGNFSLTCADGTQVTNGQYEAIESAY